MSNSDLEQVLQRVRELFATEYSRGQKDAIARIVQAAHGEPLPNGQDSKPPQTKRGQKERAPTGAARAFIDRVLSEHGSKGISPSEIHAAAMTDVEKMVSFSTIRAALTKGREERRYRNKGGKWFVKIEKESAGPSLNL